MKSVNKVILLGLVGHDPEVKYIASGIPVGRFSLATSEVAVEVVFESMSKRNARIEF